MVVPLPGSAAKLLRLTCLAALGVSGVAAAVVSAVSGLIVYQAARPHGEWGSGEPPDDVAENVSFDSVEDRTTIRGWFLRSASPTPAPTVVLCHGAWTGRRECLPLAVRLMEAGFRVLLFDFRAHGTSDGRFISVGHHEARDILGAVEYLKTRPEVDPSRIAVVGFSMGGAAAIRAAAASPDIAAVVADSAFADFVDAVQFAFERVNRVPSYPFAPVALQLGRWLIRVDPHQIRPVQAVGRIAPRPIMIVHGEEDDIVPVEHAHQLFAAAGHPRELWTVAGAGHVGARETEPEAYFARLVSFLRASLANPARPTLFADAA